MSLQAPLLAVSHPSQLINALALLFVLVGGLLLLATRWHEQIANARLLARSETLGSSAGAAPLRRFYRLGFGCLALALLISWLSLLI